MACHTPGCPRACPARTQGCPGHAPHASGCPRACRARAGVSRACPRHAPRAPGCPRACPARAPGCLGHAPGCPKARPSLRLIPPPPPPKNTMLSRNEVKVVHPGRHRGTSCGTLAHGGVSHPVSGHATTRRAARTLRISRGFFEFCFYLNQCQPLLGLPLSRDAKLYVYGIFGVF